jgi:hypothetical protein
LSGTENARFASRISRPPLSWMNSTPAEFEVAFSAFTRGRDDWARFALALIASALAAFEGVRRVRHRSRR